MRKFLILMSMALTMLSCGGPSIPQQYTESSAQPSIVPDYKDVFVPINIAPLNFMVDQQHEQCVVRITAKGGQSIVCGHGRETAIPISDWQQMLQASAGDSITVEVFASSQGGWTRYQPFHIHIADCNIDDYISYRLIEPAYTVYGQMSISQRNISNFDESLIYSTESHQGQCVNCHAYQNYKTSNMLYHKRVVDGGTVIISDGVSKKVDLKRGNAISAGVYPAWHPTASIVAFSTNKTHQLFQNSNINKVEVFDTESDLMLYDVKADNVIPIPSPQNAMETFPAWSSDGRWLYYCQANVSDSLFDGEYVSDYKAIKYDIYRRSFDMSSMSLGEPELIYKASAKGLSATLPRLSPDGKRIVFAEGEYGCFHIWHHDSDIRMLNLETGELDMLEGVNSPAYAESYPSFSSNGKWLMMASRRDDGNYSRVYISYIDGEKVCKPFLLPQQSPLHNTLRTKSYNRPEFMAEGVE